MPLNDKFKKLRIKFELKYQILLTLFHMTAWSYQIILSICYNIFEYYIIFEYD